MKARIGNRSVEIGTHWDGCEKVHAECGKKMNDSFIIYGLPIGKPRMTRSDKWKQRPCVMQYRAWADEARDAAFGHPYHKMRLNEAMAIEVTAYFQHKSRRGKHTQKPDGDNVLKACCDALFENDEMLYKKQVSKWWTDGQSRVEVRLLA